MNGLQYESEKNDNEMNQNILRIYKMLNPTTLGYESIGVIIQAESEMNPNPPYGHFPKKTGNREQGIQNWSFIMDKIVNFWIWTR